jgi:hypothetical protein
MVAEAAGYDSRRVRRAGGQAEPSLTALASERGSMLRPFEDALAEFVEQMRQSGAIGPLAVAAE